MPENVNRVHLISALMDLFLDDLPWRRSLLVEPFKLRQLFITSHTVSKTALQRSHLRFLRAEHNLACYSSHLSSGTYRTETRSRNSS